MKPLAGCGCSHCERARQERSRAYQVGHSIGTTAKRYLSLPNTITFVGLCFGITALVVHDVTVCLVFLVLSLAADLADGYVARLLEQTTAFGGRFDWQTDCFLAQLTLVRFIYDRPEGAVRFLFFCAPLLLWHAHSNGTVKVSGRTLLFALFAAHRMGYV